MNASEAVNAALAPAQLAVAFRSWVHEVAGVIPSKGDHTNLKMHVYQTLDTC